MQNSMLVFTYSAFDRKHPFKFGGKFDPKKKMQFKLKFGTLE